MNINNANKLWLKKSGTFPIQTDIKINDGFSNLDSKNDEKFLNLDKKILWC